MKIINVKKRFAGILLIALTLSCFANKKETPDSLKYLFHNNIYFRYSQGISIYLQDARNGYAAFSKDAIIFGNQIEPEIGTFIKDFIQIGLSYVYMNGTTEDTIDAINYQGYGYDDVFFSGAALKGRYFLLKRSKIIIPIGTEVLYGKFKLKSGVTDDLNRKRGITNIDVAGDYEANGFGGGLTGTFAYYPFWFMSLGVDIGLRLLYSQGLKEVSEGWELPDYKGGTQTLNLTSINLRVYLSLQW
ncbi:MAG TPA: hypothetical protein DCO75_07930 [Fibrobacteres bacterium]|jgi:hypothetical protein|nr:hypothetical protein [Fibrobacterota bacterium]